jgi:hypothetical protein
MTHRSVADGSAEEPRFFFRSGIDFEILQIYAEGLCKIHVRKLRNEGWLVEGQNEPSIRRAREEHIGNELAFVANVRRAHDTLDVLYFWNGTRLQRLVAEGDRLLRMGGTMDKIGEPALNNSGVIAFPAAIFKGPAIGGIFVAATRDLRLLVSAGDRVPSGAMILRFSEHVAIDDEDAIGFSSYLGNDGNTREAVLVNKADGLVEVAVEGAPAPGGGRYAAFGPWPTIGAGGVISFIAALDEAPEPHSVSEQHQPGHPYRQGVAEK